MADIFILMPITLTILLFVGVAFMSKSLILGGSGGLVVFAYVAVRSGNTLMLGFYLLLMFFMVMAVGVYLTKTVMGETA